MKKITTLLTAAVIAGGTINAQTDMNQYEELKKSDVLSHNGNTWGLIYDGALTENLPGKVNIHPIEYKSLDGTPLRANIYTPADYNPANSYAAIVVAHPNGGVKEQVSGMYAQLLAEKGYVTIAFDAQFQGASGGEPRHTDKPYYRMEDIRRAADIIGSYPGVDGNRLGVLGICGGGGYTLKEAQTDKRFKRVATLSAFNSGPVRRNGFLDSDVNTIQQRLADGIAARGKGELMGDMSKVTAEAADKMPFDLYREGWYYYYQNYRHPNSTFLYTKESLPELMDFDAAQGMELLNVPLLMICGKNADTLYLSEGCFSKAVNTPTKELYLVPDATHIQTYYVLEYVENVMNKLTSFFNGL